MINSLVEAVDVSLADINQTLNLKVDNKIDLILSPAGIIKNELPDK